MPLSRKIRGTGKEETGSTKTLDPNGTGSTSLNLDDTPLDVHGPGLVDGTPLTTTTSPDYHLTRPFIPVPRVDKKYLSGAVGLGEGSPPPRLPLPRGCTHPGPPLWVSTPVVRGWFGPPTRVRLVSHDRASTGVFTVSSTISPVHKADVTLILSFTIVLSIEIFSTYKSFKLCVQTYYPVSLLPYLSNPNLLFLSYDSRHLVPAAPDVRDDGRLQTSRVNMSSSGVGPRKEPRASPFPPSPALSPVRRIPVPSDGRPQDSPPAWDRRGTPDPDPSVNRDGHPWSQGVTERPDGIVGPNLRSRRVTRVGTRPAVYVGHHVAHVSTEYTPLAPATVPFCVLP